MNPNQGEINLSRVLTLLDELAGAPFKERHYEGYHPNAYNGGGQGIDLDECTQELCNQLQQADVTKYSLELQMWWRDHQAADKSRIQREIKKAKEGKERETALAKLTDYEKELLGV